MASQMSYCPVIWWRRESDWEEWEAVIFSLELRPLWFYEMFQWAQTTHWTHSLRLSPLRSLIQTSSCLSSKVSTIFWTVHDLKFTFLLFQCVSVITRDPQRRPVAPRRLQWTGGDVWNKSLLSSGTPRKFWSRLFHGVSQCGGAGLQHVSDPSDSVSGKDPVDPGSKQTGFASQSVRNSAD